MKVEQLIKIGFIKAGYWHMGKKGLTFHLDADPKMKKEVVYAFVSDNDVYYIGKSDDTLHGRMTNYKSGKEENKSGITNKKVRSKINEILGSGGKVEIYVLSDIELNHKGFKVSLSSGIEPSLIKALDPNLRWNARHTGSNHKKKPINTRSPDELNSENSTLLSTNIVVCKLGKEYYNKGVFAFGSGVNKDLLPNFANTNVSIIIGGNKRPLSGTFTSSGKRRFVCGHDDLIKWYKRDFNEGDSIQIEILGKDKYKLSKIK